MSQLIHILNKDILYLKNEILMFYGFLGLYVWTELNPATAFLTFPILGQVMLPFVGAFLIARVVHAEAIPGINQFWTTRPYRWNSLLGAKLVFAVLCIHLPMFAVRYSLLLLQGFPSSPGVWSILWSQFLMLMVLTLPLAALAGMTPGIVQFALGALVGIAVPIALFALDQSYMTRMFTGASLGESTRWVRDAFAACALVFGGAGLLWLEYRTRRVFQLRLLAIGLLFFGSIVYLYFPESVAAKANAVFADKQERNSFPQIRIEPLLHVPHRVAFGDLVFVGLDLHILPAVGDGRIDIPQFTLTLERADGESRRIQFNASFLRDAALSDTSPNLPFRASGFVEKAFLDYQMNGQMNTPIRIHGSIDVIVMAPPRIETIRLGSTPVNVTDRLQCFLTPHEISSYRQSNCRTAVSGWGIGTILISGSGKTVELEGPGTFVRFSDRKNDAPFPMDWMSLNSAYEYKLRWIGPVPEEFVVSSEFVRRRLHWVVDIADVQLIREPEGRK